MFKKLLSMVLCVVMVLAIGTTAFAAPSEDTSKLVNYRNLDNNSKIVYDFIDSINSGNWDNWVSFYTSTVQI